MLPLLTLFLFIFTGGYIVFSFVVIYHFRRYSLPTDTQPRRVTIIYIFISSIAWLWAVASLIAFR